MSRVDRTTAPRAQDRSAISVPEQADRCHYVQYQRSLADEDVVSHGALWEEARAESHWWDPCLAGRLSKPGQTGLRSHPRPSANTHTWGVWWFTERRGCECVGLRGRPRYSAQCFLDIHLSAL